GPPQAGVSKDGRSRASSHMFLHMRALLEQEGCGAIARCSRAAGPFAASSPGSDRAIQDAAASRGTIVVSGIR
ncbi:hypothetical protein, partial [Bradyrhizobium canariense]|uniref:hypothetical protein n=1 Tax=Bradyrhizobium canariense TaxID=255045 RepID=UPI001CA4DA14